MSDRDKFALAALQGLLASDSFVEPSEAARLAYVLADAMLAERARTTAPVEEIPFA